MKKKLNEVAELCKPAKCFVLPADLSETKGVEPIGQKGHGLHRSNRPVDE